MCNGPLRFSLFSDPTLIHTLTSPRPCPSSYRDWITRCASTLSDWTQMKTVADSRSNCCVHCYPMSCQCLPPFRSGPRKTSLTCLKSMKMSMLLSVLFFSAHVSTSLPLIDPKCTLLSLLQAVPINVFRITDSANKKDTHSQHENMLPSAKPCIADSYSCVQQWVVMARVLHKPNFHRLFKLCVNSIPCFGHGLALIKLVL